MKTIFIKLIKEVMGETSRLDKSMILIAVLLLAVTVYLVFHLDELLTEKGELDRTLSIGEISYRTRDVRYRNSSQLSWNKAKKQNSIFWNDSVFTGKKSQANINLKNGTKVKLKSNSLVKFKKRKNLNLMQLTSGQFELDLRGDTEVEIGGKITKISGKGAKLKISVDKKTGKPKFRVLSGKVKVTDSRGVRLLQKTPAVKVTRKRLPAPEMAQEPREVYYIHKFYDQYEKKREADREVLVRKQKYVYNPNKKIKFRWKSLAKASSHEVHLLKLNSFRTESFDNKKRVYENILKKRTAEPSADLRLQSFGDYRVKVKSLDIKGSQWDSPWSLAVNFKFKSKSLPIQPKFFQRTMSVPLTGNSYPLSLRWELGSKVKKYFKNYLIEVSRDKHFPALQTKVFISQEMQLNLNLSKKQNYYFRVRGVTEEQELGVYSETLVAIPFEPKPLVRPQILNTNNFRLSHNLKTRKWFRWTHVPQSKNYQMEVFSQDQKRVVFSAKTGVRRYFWRTKVPGNYKLRVKAMDRYGRSSPYSYTKSFVVEEEPVRSVLAKNKNEKKKQKEKTEEKKEERKTASENTLRKKMEHNKKQSYNKNYGNSNLQMEGASLALLNSTAQDTESDFALAMGMTLRGLHWWKPKHGVEGAFKTKVVGYNDEGQKINPMSVDLRYHYRLRYGLIWPSFIRQFQISLFSGLEHYSNSSEATVDFVNAYTVFKLGTALKIPLWQRWETGGEFAYGSGMRGISKLEMQGYVNYYIRSRWSLGLGYRLHLFKVTDVSDSPDGRVPYGEAYAEGFGSLRYSF